MWGKTTDDIAETLMQMQTEAQTVCRFNQTEMAKTMARWMGQDRRFDGVPDKEALARDAMDAQAHGRVLDITPRFRIDGNMHRTV